jgi:membrane fusion protein, heavy metal efflux system
MMKRLKTLSLVLLCLFVAAGCGSDSEAQPKPAAAAPPAVVHGVAKEAELATVTLNPEAEKRLGIALAAVEKRAMATYRTLSGEVTLPPGHSQTLTVPVAGTLVASGRVPQGGASVQRGELLYRLLPLERESRGQDLRAQAERDLGTAQARLEAARLRFQRAEQLLRDGAGSQRNLEEAKLELSQVEVAEKAARDQLNYLSQTAFDSAQGLAIEAPQSGMVLKTYVSPGQVVPAGATVVDIARTDPVWIRVPVYVGELRDLSGSRSILVHAIGATPGKNGGVNLNARRITGVPSANAAAATADLFYEIANAPLTFRPGEKVGVSFGTDQAETLVVPWSAIIHDINGGEWVYENVSPQTYSRRRVEVLHVRDGFAALARGPKPGVPVVKTGAAELFGTEFGVGK